MEKTKLMGFTQQRIKIARVLMYGKQTGKLNSFRFLGVTFDFKVTWIEHKESGGKM